MLKIGNFLPFKSKNYNNRYSAGVLYYGLNKESWPINYLNAIDINNVKDELKYIKSMGFNSIYLLASWSEFEPKIGVSETKIYQRINQIIKNANSLNLGVFIRIPYLWSLKGDQIVDRIIFALINHQDYRDNLFNFIRSFKEKVVDTNSNIISLFTSWEDFYIVLHEFFKDNSTSKIIRASFHNSTEIDPNLIVKNGTNYQHLLNWVNENINQILLSISDYGYEIRTDFDLIMENNEIKWHNNIDSFPSKSKLKIFSYWAPFYGQKNIGEKINTEDAIKSIKFKFSLLQNKIASRPIVSQLNFYDNSPNTNHLAALPDSEIPIFFEKVKEVLKSYSSGYAFWIIRDYSHNIIFNPIFSLLDKGWNSSSKRVKFSLEKVIMPTNCWISQQINDNFHKILLSELIIIRIEVVNGKGSVKFNQRKIMNLSQGKTNEIEINANILDIKMQNEIRIENNSQPAEDLVIKAISFTGHLQKSKILDQNLNVLIHYQIIKNFNKEMLKQ